MTPIPYAGLHSKMLLVAWGYSALVWRGQLSGCCILSFTVEFHGLLRKTLTDAEVKAQQKTRGLAA